MFIISSILTTEGGINDIYDILST